MSFMRTSLVPGLLQSVFHNQCYGNTSLRLFEVGNVFSEDRGGTAKLVENVLEEGRICLIICGESAPRGWDRSGRLVDFFDMKGEVASVLAKLLLDKWRFISYSTTNTLAEEALGIEINDSYAGHLGRASRETLAGFGIEQDVYFAELKTSLLGSSRRAKFKSLPKFQKVKRDVAFVVNVETPGEVIERTIRESASALLNDVELFDVYAGEKLPGGKKSLGFSLSILSPEKTLAEAEIDAEVNRIVEGVSRQIGATLRTF
jgi:phenylalanyl-tRNA synthetase beta chain